ncbi:MAG: hypothetical protein JXA71_13125 [Chitinispirillaceae bacterium]|nr:hypothetical protein [Chitinispirillaceae bacterium]
MPRTLYFFARDLLVYSAITAVLSGFCLAWYYVPLPERAGLAVDHIKESVFAGRIMVDVHAFSAALTLLMALVLCGMSFFITADFRTRLTVFLLALPVLILAVAAKITGLLLALHPEAVSLYKSFISRMPELPAPELFDTAVLPFVRAFLIHAMIIPVLTAGFLWLLIRRPALFTGARNRDPIVRHPARFAGFTTLLVMISIFFGRYIFP